LEKGVSGGTKQRQGKKKPADVWCYIGPNLDWPQRGERLPKQKKKKKKKGKNKCSAKPKSTNKGGNPDSEGHKGTQS